MRLKLLTLDQESRSITTRPQVTPSMLSIGYGDSTSFILILSYIDLINSAIILLHTTGSDQDDDVEQSSRYKSCIMTPPNLGDIKLKIEIP